MLQKYIRYIGWQLQWLRYLVIPACNVDTRTDELRNVEAWSLTNNLTLNRPKSVEIVFTNSRRKAQPQLQSDNCSLKILIDWLIDWLIDCVVLGQRDDTMLLVTSITRYCGSDSETETRRIQFVIRSAVDLADWAWKLSVMACRQKCPQYYILRRCVLPIKHVHCMHFIQWTDAHSKPDDCRPVNEGDVCQPRFDQ